MLQCECEDLGLDVPLPTRARQGSIFGASEGHFQELLLPKVSLGQCLASSVFSKHLLKRGWVGGGEELLYFCNEGKG